MALKELNQQQQQNLLDKFLEAKQRYLGTDPSAKEIILNLFRIYIEYSLSESFLIATDDEQRSLIAYSMSLTIDHIERMDEISFNAN